MFFLVQKTPSENREQGDASPTVLSKAIHYIISGWMSVPNKIRRRFSEEFLRWKRITREKSGEEVVTNASTGTTPTVEVWCYSNSNRYDNGIALPFDGTNSVEVDYDLLIERAFSHLSTFYPK